MHNCRWRDIEEHYDFELINKPEEPLPLDLGKMLKELIADIQKGLTNSVISAKFHNCLAAGLLEMAKAVRESTKLNTVALSGGVFCNRYLTNRLVKLLRESDFSVLFNRDVPSNDGGISVGQAAIAARLVTRDTTYKE
ncbi:MAG: Kae1-like domain-containing protein [Planctomycetota bacterium]|jgi:hydrogenase maturation protein HypF